MQGMLKLNFDASFVQETNEATMGAIIRDCLGDVICSMSDQLTSCSEAEAKALLRCLSNCTMQGIYPTEVETDCAAVFYAVNAGHQNMSKLCYIFREIDRIRRNDFNFSLSLVKRDCNTTAHELAKLARVEGFVGLWFSCVSEQIRPSVWNDCNQLLNE
jgi:ribonuclease HI